MQVKYEVRYVGQVCRSGQHAGQVFRSGMQARYAGYVHVRHPGQVCREVMLVRYAGHVCRSGTEVKRDQVCS
jgi:hypothetical protein